MWPEHCTRNLSLHSPWETERFSVTVYSWLLCVPLSALCLELSINLSGVREKYTKVVHTGDIYILPICTMGKRFTFWRYLTTLGIQVEAGRSGN